MARFADQKGTVARTLELIQFFGSARSEWTLGELAAAANLPPSTLHRLLKLLQAEGFVESDEQTRRYRPGAELFRIGAMLSSRMPIIALAMPILRDIVSQSDETTLLSLYYPRQLQKAFVAQVESTRSMRYVIELNIRTSLLWGASAHAILAYLDADTVAQVLAQRDPSPASSEPPNRKELVKELARIRSEGYAWSAGEGVAMALGLAVPVFGADGAVKGSLSVTYPDFRMDDALNRKLLTLLRDGARTLSKALGWNETSGPAPFDLIKVDARRPVMRSATARKTDRQ
jgi:DNA-binding IclR family transcriptional regulator